MAWGRGEACRGREGEEKQAGVDLRKEGRILLATMVVREGCGEGGAVTMVGRRR